jgi:oligosaccharide repeat unit polymerase
VGIVSGGTMMRKKLNSAYQLPIVLVCIYLIFTLVLYAIGPLDWVTYHPIIFWLLQITYIMMLYLGWQFGRKKSYVRKEEWSEKQDKRILKKLPLLLIINLGYEFINLFRKFNMSSMSVSGLLNKVVLGFTDIGGSYNSFQDSIGTIAGAQVVGGSVVTLFNYIWEFVAFAVVLISLFYYKQLKKRDRVISILTYVLILVSYISTGTNIGVFRLLLAIVVFYALKVIRGERTIDRAKWRRRKKWIIVITIVAVVFATVLFDKIMQSRGGILYWESDWYNIGGIHINNDSVLLNILPKSWMMLLISATGYLTQGYYGMSLCLTESWMPTFGLGYSMAIVKLLKEYASDTLMNRTYQHRIEHYGWDSNVQWHSMYTWIANDVSFIGVILVMFLVGMVGATAYKDSIITNNPFAHLMVYYFALLAFFIPCNNQIFQSTYVMFSFWTVFILWLCTRGKRRVRLRIRR